MTSDPPKAAEREERASQGDKWFAWLSGTRHGGDPAYARALEPMLDDIRERLIDHAALEPGDSIADIGCGDGRAGFGALDRQPNAQLTFVDISPALIAHTRALAERRGVASRSRFLVASAEQLDAIPDGSVDVVLVRAVLAYLDDRAAAIAELRRILRPGGRVSIVDPIFQDIAFAVAGMARTLRAGNLGLAGRPLELVQRVRAAQFPATLEAIQAASLTNYNERDLLRLCEAAGFVDLHLRLHIDSILALPMAWTAYVASSPHAAAPTVGEVLATRFSAAERAEFEAFVRPGVEAGTATERNVNAYLFGVSGS
jgi:SAM-dependent methyltransferase